MKFIAILLTAFISVQTYGQEKFPDGTPIPDWFRQNEIVNIETLGNKYNLADYGIVKDSTLLQTEKIQSVIDQASQKGAVSLLFLKELTSAVHSSSNRKHTSIWKKAPY